MFVCWQQSKTVMQMWIYVFHLWQEIEAFTTSLINQLSLNIQRIHRLGINKVAVSLLGPIGCLPQITLVTFHLKCVDILNLVSQNHNNKLIQTVQELNQQAGKSVFVTLDLYNAFLSTISTMQKKHDGILYMFLLTAFTKH